MMPKAIVAKFEFRRSRSALPKGEMHMNYLKAFIAGFASTLVFHQGLL